MGWWKISAAMIAALPLACAASAQPDQRRGAVGYLENPESATAAQVMVTFARCFARRQERAAEPVLRMPYFSEEQGAAAHRLIREYDDCLGDQRVALRFQIDLLIGGMAEHFIVRRYEHVDISPLAIMSDAVATSGFAGRNAYETLSLCVIRRDPAAARALIATVPRTPRERAAFDRIIPNLAPCVPADLQMTFSRSALRRPSGDGSLSHPGRVRQCS